MMHKLFDSAEEKPHPAPQKFHSLMVKGLVKNGCKVTCLVALPVTVRSHPNKKIWKRCEEIVDGVRYVYMPFYNSPYPKLLEFKIYAFFFTLLWILRTNGCKAMLCDVLNAHSSGSMKACRLMRVKCAGIVTDIPGMMVGQKKDSFLRRFFIWKDNRNIRYMTHLVPLTEAMCDLINPQRKKPYIVVEGLVDSELEANEPTPYQDGKKHITYTGALNARYGVRNLIEGFMQLKQKDVVLDIYGKGPMVEEMAVFMEKDSRIVFHGIVPIEESVRAQRSSFLLVNPRPTSEEFTKYSFPSKNMEYMVSGVPLVTTVLPGMPKEYYPYVFLLKDETPDGIASLLDEILNMSEDMVRDLGIKGKEFVLNNKNNIRQAERILQLLEVKH